MSETKTYFELKYFVATVGNNAAHSTGGYGGQKFGKTKEIARAKLDRDVADVLSKINHAGDKVWASAEITHTQYIKHTEESE